MSGAVAPEEWTELALCAQVAPDLWFPEKAEGFNSTREAKKTCAACEVRAECLEAGLDERFGIWGGLSERERRKIVRERRGEAA